MSQFCRLCTKLIGIGIFLAMNLLVEGEPTTVASGAAPLLVTNLLQLHRLLNHNRRVNCTLRLRATVCVASPAQRFLVLSDDSGAELLHLDFKGNNPREGDSISLDGTNCAVVRKDCGLGIEQPPLIDNNGVHGLLEKSGSVSLSAGLHPIQVDWFNGGGPFGLILEYAGPGLPRQAVPASVLSRAVLDTLSGQTNFIGGLNYRCEEGGWWNTLPDFDAGTVAGSGVVSNFDLTVRSRDEFVALKFDGYLRIPRTGDYTFYLTSDDGSELLLDEPSYLLACLGKGVVPHPRQLAIGELLGGGEDAQWGEIEGVVSFVSNQEGRLEMELKSESGRIQVRVMNRKGLSPTILLNSRVRLTGVCYSVLSLEGKRIPGTMMVTDWRHVETLDLAPAVWKIYPVETIAGMTNTLPDENGERIVHVAGRVHSSGHAQEVLDPSGEVAFRSVQALRENATQTVDVIGLLDQSGDTPVIQSAFCQEQGKPSNVLMGSLPLLTSAAQVKELSRDEARAGYPVAIRGIVIGIISGFPSFVIEDSTSGIFVRSQELGRTDPPQLGEIWQIDGLTGAGDFAPIVIAQKLQRLDESRLPDPLHPTWDQLINGSADTQYGELEGVVTDVETNCLSLLCRGGKIKVDLPEMSESSLRRYENRLVRIRGCILAIWNVETHQAMAGEIRIANPTISADAPSSPDLFATTPLKQVSDLMRFDLRANAFQHVKVAGQLTRREGREYFLQDGLNGLRFIPKTVPELKPGDLVEVVGLPELGGASPILREASVRKTDQARTLTVVRLSQQDLNRPGLDATWVRVEGTLLNLNNEPAERVFEIQTGFRVFAALMPVGSPPIKDIPIGSRLGLRGVYCSLGSEQMPGRGSDSFELLLNSSDDVQVLSRPTWWTLRRVLIILGVLTGALIMAAAWIKQLHHEVGERTAQLESQIKTRERLEYQGNLERERTRIARDLHDELGADLTEISMLAQDSPEYSSGQANRVLALIRNLVVKLDEVVWAVDPTMDNTVSLVNYLTGFAEEFLEAAKVTCRVRMPTPIPEWPLPAHVRHQLFLAVKEALNNAVRHGHANEVVLQLNWQDDILEISVQDYGLGFDSSQTTNGNGLRNLQERLININGRCIVESQPGKGTKVRFVLALKPPETNGLGKNVQPL